VGVAPKPAFAAPEQNAFASADIQICRTRSGPEGKRETARKAELTKMLVRTEGMTKVCKTVELVKGRCHVCEVRVVTR
jgi:hypothetical protein